MEQSGDDPTYHSAIGAASNKTQIVNKSREVNFEKNSSLYRDLKFFYYICIMEGKIISSFDEVERFLSNLFGKLTISEIRFLDNRDKNLATLAELELPRNKRTEIIKTLTVQDYSEGPIKDALNLFGDMWVFGKDVKNQEIYIKISLGIPNKDVICISFHKSEFPMTYPYKK